MEQSIREEFGAEAAGDIDRDCWVLGIEGRRWPFSFGFFFRRQLTLPIRHLRHVAGELHRAAGISRQASLRLEGDGAGEGSFPEKHRLLALTEAERANFLRGAFPLELEVHRSEPAQSSGNPVLGGPTVAGVVR